MTEKLYAYLMTYDSGFATNPFFGLLTLATCMTDTPRTKQLCDWVADFTGKPLIGKCRALGIKIPHQGLIYLMQIGEILTLDACFHDPRFRQKKGITLGSNNTKLERGDNIYCSDGNRGFFAIGK